MASWQPLLPPGLPPELEGALTTARDAVTALQELINVIKTPLETVLGFIASDVNPALFLLQNILNETRGLLQQFADVSLFWLTLHPWTPNAGSPGVLNPYLLELPTARFLQLLEGSINDKGDQYRPTGSGVLFGLAAGANDPMGFVEGLRALGTLLNLQELLTLGNRVEAVQAIEETTDQNIFTPLEPNWNNAGRLHNIIPPLGNLILRADSILESFETSTHGAQAAVITLENTINKKLEMLQKANEALGQMQEALNQNFGNVYLLESTGAFSGSISSSSGYPDFKYNAGVLVAGSTVDLKPLQTLLKGS